jgi:hypothetical protein
MKTRARALTALLCLGLGLSIGLQFLDRIIPPPPPTKSGTLAETLPTNLEGWKVTDVPIAETEEMKANVESRLVYDDHVVRLYERGATAVMVYVAYWSPGKMPYRMVGAHSPDTCWVQNGWSRSSRDQWKSCPDGRGLEFPIEFGTYERQGLLQHVIFWHLVGGETYGFDQLEGHNFLGLFHDFARFGLQQRREQFFIRVSSNRPMAELWRNPDFVSILEPITRLGRVEGAPPLIPLPSA